MASEDLGDVQPRNGLGGHPEHAAVAADELGEVHPLAENQGVAGREGEGDLDARRGDAGVRPEFVTGVRDANWSDWYAEYLVAEQAGKELPT